jgi:polar amino acid transport system substrate-binding protein
MVLFVLSAILFCAVVFLLLKAKTSQKNNKNIKEELAFFRKEKEYYEEAILMFSDKKEIIFANQSAKKLLNLSVDFKSYLIDSKIYLETQNNIKGNFFDVLEKANSKKANTFNLSNVIFRIEGQEIYVNIFIDKSLWNIDQTMICVLDTHSVKSDLYRAIDKKGAIDFLTGLPSQFVAIEDINTLILNYKERLNSFGLFLLGIDSFKSIQKRLGLGYSHQIIKQVGYYFLQHPHKNISVYCIDSDKFLFLVKDLGKEEDIQEFARGLLNSINILNKEYNELRLTSSIGISQYPKDHGSAEKLLDSVYTALEKAHAQGESSIYTFSKEDIPLSLEDVEMDKEIQKALLYEGFTLYYQPIFDLKSETIIAVKSFLRWNHPTKGIIALDAFIDVAKEAGLMIDIAEYLFKEAIQERQRCMRYVSDDFTISITFSLKNIEIEALIPRIAEFFDRYKVAKEMIAWDIDESEALEDIEKTVRNLRLLKEFGLSLSLTHFASKYTSFKYLALLPIDSIKIDRSLIFELTLENNAELTVHAIIEMAHILGYKVLAEGVETSQEVRILNRLDCDYAQGYLYSRPIDAQDLEKLLA